MTTRVAALLALACSLVACGSMDGQAQMPAGGGSTYGGKGVKPAAGRLQELDAVKIEGVTPQAEPKLRYSAAICKQDDKRCNFTVSVKGDCHVSLDPEWMAIGRRLDRVTLVFTLRDSPGYSLKGTPVHDKGKDEGFFRNQRVRDDNVVEVVIDNHFNKVKEYALEVRKGDDVCATLDPPIIPDI